MLSKPSKQLFCLPNSWRQVLNGWDRIYSRLCVPCTPIKRSFKRSRLEVIVLVPSFHRTADTGDCYGHTDNSVHTREQSALAQGWVLVPAVQLQGRSSAL